MDSFNERIISPGQGMRNVASVKIYIYLSSGQNHHEIIFMSPFHLSKILNESQKTTDRVLPFFLLMKTKVNVWLRWAEFLKFISVLRVRNRKKLLNSLTAVKYS